MLTSYEDIKHSTSIIIYYTVHMYVHMRDEPTGQGTVSIVASPYDHVIVVKEQANSTTDSPHLNSLAMYIERSPSIKH